MNIKEIFNPLNINKGDKILVNSSILKIIIKYQKANKQFVPNQIIDVLTEKISNTGTLLLPTFNWDFCRGLGFDYFNSITTICISPSSPFFILQSIICI